MLKTEEKLLGFKQAGTKDQAMCASAFDDALLRIFVVRQRFLGFGYFWGKFQRCLLCSEGFAFLLDTKWTLHEITRGNSLRSL